MSLRTRTLRRAPAPVGKRPCPVPADSAGTGPNAVGDKASPVPHARSGRCRRVANPYRPVVKGWQVDAVGRPMVPRFPGRSGAAWPIGSRRSRASALVALATRRVPLEGAGIPGPFPGRTAETEHRLFRSGRPFGLSTLRPPRLVLLGDRPVEKAWISHRCPVPRSGTWPHSKAGSCGLCDLGCEGISPFW